MLESAEIDRLSPNALMVSLEGNRVLAEIYGSTGHLGPELPAARPLQADRPAAVTEQVTPVEAPSVHVVEPVPTKPTMIGRFLNRVLLGGGVL